MAKNKFKTLNWKTFRELYDTHEKAHLELKEIPLIYFMGKTTRREMQLAHPGKHIKKMFTEINGKKVYSYIVVD